MKHNDSTDANDEMLSEIFEHASPRPQPSSEIQERAYATLRDEWLEISSKRRTQRRIMAWSLAATVLIAAVLGFRNISPVDTPPHAVVAELVRVSGNSVVANKQPITASTQLGAAMSLSPGDTIETGARSLVAMSWNVGGSLRLDQNTHIEIVSGEAVRLIKGAVYFDSRQFGQPVNPQLEFAIETPYGRVTHVGTQFLLQMDSNRLAVSVREGEVRIDGPNVENVAVYSGSAMTFTSGGDWWREPVAAHDDRWDWAAEAAPTLQLKGRTHKEFFDWIGRETGREISYRSDFAKQNADAELVGIDSLGPTQALRQIPLLTGLRFEIADNVIIVE